MKKEKTILFIFFGFLLLASFLFFFLFKNKKLGSESSQASDGQLTVMTTIFPLFDMARAIGGEEAEIKQLLPPGLEAHSFEPKPSDILKIQQADIFVYAGEAMEPWVVDIIKSLSADGPLIVDASQEIELLSASYQSEEHEHDHVAEAENISGERNLDPHIWLDFSRAASMADNIATAFIEKNPAAQEIFLTRLKDYQASLSDLDRRYQEILSSCRHDKIIYGGHYAFGYLAARYSLHYLAAQGFSPDSEPSANDLIALTRQMKDEKIGYIFYEEISSPKIATTIAAETGAKMLLLNAAHNLPRDEFEAGRSFFAIMDANLENLRLGLECE